MLLYRSKLLDSPVYTDPPAAMNEPLSFFYYFGLIGKKRFQFPTGHMKMRYNQTSNFNLLNCARKGAVQKRITPIAFFNIYTTFYVKFYPNMFAK